MRRWPQLAVRNWQVKRVRTLGALLAIALGVGAVVWVSCCYESVRQTVMNWAGGYVGRSHINIESHYGKYGQFALRRVEAVKELPNVETFNPLLVQRLRGRVVRRTEYAPQQRYDPWSSPEVDYHGIDLATEFAVRDYEIKPGDGRMLRADDRYACVLEKAYAQEQGVGPGDYLVAWNESGDTQVPLEIVGLTERRRIARFQPPMALVRLPVLQEVNFKTGFVTSVDLVLRDASDKAVAATTLKVRRIVREQNARANVRSAEARMRQVNLAQQQQEVILALLSSVAMLTALFIILSTLSMGMLERIAQLGLMRCIGVTGAQLATLVLVEVVPLGLMGILLGIPLGLLLTRLTVWMVPGYVGEFVVSWRGIGLAVVAGFVTTLVAASLPAIAALRVSPLEAARPRARPARRLPLLLAALLAGAVLLLQAAIVAYKVQRNFQFVHWSATSVVLLYFVYALAAPLLVWILGRPAVLLVARLVGVRTRLLQDQVGLAVWRSAGIVCGLMVGLSLIVTLVVLNRSFRAGWQFPKQFPEAFVWNFDELPMSPDQIADRLARHPDVREFTLANALNVIVEEKNPEAMKAQVFHSATWFVGCDPDSFLDMVKLEFIEGDEETARRLLKEGGYLLVAVDFARSRHKGVVADPDQGITNTVQVWFGDRGWRTFKIAGVVDSPALDIAASFFQAQSELRVVAVGSVIGTNADLKRYFGLDHVRLVLLNFDLPPAELPPDWPPPRGSPEAAGLLDEHYDRRVPRAARWESAREETLLRELRNEIGAYSAFYGTARALKDQIDAELNNVTYLLTAVPAVALIVAAVGVANLMTANVTSRTRQLAILRAVGATRGLILRMVIGEALVLGALGSALGLALGVHLAWNVSRMTVRFSGFETTLAIPWPMVSAAVGLTVGLCILAGILPARHASRTNVIDALHVA